MYSVAHPHCDLTFRSSAFACSSSDLCIVGALCSCCINVVVWCFRCPCVSSLHTLSDRFCSYIHHVVDMLHNVSLLIAQHCHVFIVRFWRPLASRSGSTEFDPSVHRCDAAASSFMDAGPGVALETYSVAFSVAHVLVRSLTFAFQFHICWFHKFIVRLSYV